MTLSRAIGRASPPTASTAARRTLARSSPQLRAACASSLRLSLAHARHFRSTPSAFFDDFNDTESFLRQLQGAKKLKDQKKAQEAQKRTLKAQKRDQEAPKRKPLEDQALKNKQARERREKEQKWVRARQTLQQQVQDAEAKLQLLQCELKDIPHESAKIVRQRIEAQWKRIVEQSRQRTRKQTAQYGCINDAIIAIQSKIAAIVNDRMDRLRSRLDSVNRAILAIQSRKAAIVNDCIDRLRSRLDGVESAILDIRSEIYAIGTRRKAVLQSLCLEIETMLPSTYWQLRYEADDLKEEINKWRPQLVAAAAQKRREERSNIYGWKAIGRRTASEIWSTLSDHMAKLLPTVHYKTELLERKLREHNPILLSRRNFAAKWRERMNEYEKLGVEVSDQMHKVDVALERRYSGNSETVLKICDTFEEVREVMIHLEQDFSKMRLYWRTLKGERDWRIYAAYGQHSRNILKVYDRIAELNMEISTLNRYIQRDIDHLVYRDQFMALFKRRNSDLEVLRNAYLIQPFERFGKSLTGFNRVRKRMEDWYWDNRGKIIEVLGQTEWKRRRALLTKFKRAAQDWNDVRDEELSDLYNEVKRVSEQLRGLKRLEEGRERIETSLTESFFRHCEDTSFFDDQKPGDMAPTVLWAFMRMWPERYFEAGMIGLKEQMSVAQERRDKVTVLRVKGVLSKAKRLAEERRHDQDKRLKLAGVYREPRYDLDKPVVEDKAAAERSNRAYFSYELYRANSERVQDEQEPLPGSPELRYHATNATHSDVLRGMGGKFVGFDLRWNPVARDEDGPKANTSLLMIATDSTIHLLHLARQRNVQPLITEEIKRVLESPDIFKVTVGSEEKCARLQKFLGVNPRGFIDLEDLHYDLQAKAGRTVSRSPLTLQDLMFEYLGYGLHPEAADMTVDLALRLRRTDQVAMGSNVYACFALWHTIYAEGQQKAEKAALLDRQRSAEQKALWERRRSIFSSFSEAPAPNSARRLPDRLSEEGADDADGFYTASKPTDSQTTSASPSLTDIWKSATETEMEKPGPAVMDAAMSWVSSFLGSEDVSSSDGSSRRHQLLSYCLWHYGGFDVLAIAGNLSPEMANALPTDILEAIDRDGVPYDEKRVSELVEMLPEEVVWAEKYRRIARVVEFRRNGSSAQPSSMSHATRLPGIGHRGLEEYHEAEAWAVGFLRSRSSSDARADQSGLHHDSGVLRRLCLYRLWHSHRWGLRTLGQVVFGGEFPGKKRRVLAKRILSVISTNRLPYGGAVEEFLGALDKKSSGDFKNFVRVSNLAKESHAVMTALGSQAEAHDSMRAIVLEQRYDEAQKWARARLDEPCDKHRFYRYLYYRLWDHWNLSIDAIGTEYAPERPSKLIALDIVGAIKYYGMPPGNEERMAELRRLLAEDLPEFSPSTDGGSGDPRRHWTAAEEWAQTWARRDSERKTMFRHYEYPRRLSMLTLYRLWQNYNCSVAALRKAVFPTDFAPARKEATIANHILVVLSTWPTMDYEAPRLKELMGLLPEEVVQTSFQELAKRTGFNISAGAQGAVPVPMKADRAPKQLRKARSSTMDAAALMRMSYVGNYEEPTKEEAGNKGIETSEGAQKQDGNIDAARRTHLRRDKRSTKEERGNGRESRASARSPQIRNRRAGTLRSRRQ